MKQPKPTKLTSEAPVRWSARVRLLWWKVAYHSVSFVWYRLNSLNRPFGRLKCKWARNLDDAWEATGKAPWQQPNAGGER